MPDTNNDPDDADSNTDVDTFEKRTTKRLGQLGTDVFKEERKRTNMREMVEEVEITAFQVCECGNTLDSADETYRCGSCGNLACVECRIRLNRYNYCPECVQHALGIPRDVFYTLYLLNERVISLDDLMAVDAVADELMDIRISDTAAALLEYGFIRTDKDDEDAAALSNDEPLSADGKQALHIGEQLYGEDPDVVQFKKQVAIRKAAESGQ